VITAAMVTPAVPASAAPTFSDVPPSGQFAAEISWLADEGISTGYTDGTFRPLVPVARDAMAAFLYRLAGRPDFTPPATSPFRDVPVTNQFYLEIAWLAHEGISTGYADGTFRPLLPVARDAMAAFLYRFSGSPAHTPSIPGSFWDVPSSSQFFPEISWLADRGVSTGYDEGLGCYAFRPLKPVNRDAMAAFMYRLVEGGVGTAPDGSGCPAHPPHGQDVTRELLALVNEARAAEGAGPLSYNPTLVLSACQHSRSQELAGEMYHSESNGVWYGENVAWNYRSVTSVFQGWMESPGHRANIVRSWFTSMGACVSDTGYFWTQQFR
jgi:hypothetical protein